MSNFMEKDIYFSVEVSPLLSLISGFGCKLICTLISFFSFVAF